MRGGREAGSGGARFSGRTKFAVPVPAERRQRGGMPAPVPERGAEQGNTLPSPGRERQGARRGLLSSWWPLPPAYNCLWFLSQLRYLCVRGGCARVRYRGSPEDGSRFLCNAGGRGSLPRQPPVKQVTAENLPGCNLRKPLSAPLRFSGSRRERAESSNCKLYCFVTVFPSLK